jgi:hypothetical protein
MRRLFLAISLGLVFVLTAFGQRNDEWGADPQAAIAIYGKMQNITPRYDGYFGENITIYEEQSRTFNIHYFFNSGKLFRYTMIYGEVTINFARNQYAILTDMYGQFSDPRQATSFGLVWDGGSYKYENKYNQNTTIIFEQVPIGAPGSSRFFLQIHFFNPAMELVAVGRENSIDVDIQAAVESERQQRERLEREAEQARVQEEYTREREAAEAERIAEREKEAEYQRQVNERREASRRREIEEVADRENWRQRIISKNIQSLTFGGDGRDHTYTIGNIDFQLAEINIKRNITLLGDRFSFTARGNRITVFMDGKEIFRLQFSNRLLNRITVETDNYLYGIIDVR